MTAMRNPPLLDAVDWESAVKEEEEEEEEAVQMTNKPNQTPVNK